MPFLSFSFFCLLCFHRRGCCSTNAQVGELGGEEVSAPDSQPVHMSLSAANVGRSGEVILRAGFAHLSTQLFHVSIIPCVAKKDEQARPQFTRLISMLFSHPPSFKPYAILFSFFLFPSACSLISFAVFCFLLRSAPCKSHHHHASCASPRCSPCLCEKTNCVADRNSF